MSLFFDFDGPLVDNYPRLTGLFYDLAKEIGFSPISKSLYWEQKRDCVPEKAILKQCSGMTEEKENQYFELRELRIEEKSYLSLNQITNQCHESLSYFKQFDDLVLVTTRQNKEHLLWELRDKKLDAYFSKILCGFDRKRPAWEVKYQMILKSGVSFRSSNFIIGDTEAEILCGKKLGICTVATLNGIRNQRQLNQHEPQLFVENLEQLAQIWSKK